MVVVVVGPALMKFTLNTSISAFLKHALREVTCGVCKGTVPALPRALRMPKNNSKETYSVPPEVQLLVKNMWGDSQVVQRYRTRGAPFPQECSKFRLKTVLGTRPEGTFAPRHVWETPTILTALSKAIAQGKHCLDRESAV